MAERSFAREVQDLRLGAGEEFRGEGILAVTKALLQSGVGYVAGYQGAPISHLMDVLSDAQDILGRARRAFRDVGQRGGGGGDARRVGDVSDPRRGDVEIHRRDQCRVGRPVQPRVRRRDRRRADHHRRGLRRGFLDHAGAHACLRDEVADLADGPAAEPADPSCGGGGRVRPVGSEQHAGDAGDAHPRLPRARQLHRQGQHRRRRSPCAQALDDPARDVSRIVLPPASFLHEQEKINQPAGQPRVAFIRDTRPERDDLPAMSRSSASSCRAACTTASCAP